MDATMDSAVDLSATLELRPGTGQSYGRTLNKRASRSFRSVSTTSRRAPGDGRRSATPSLYRTRFQRTGESAAASASAPPPKPQQQQPQPLPPPPPEQAWAEEEAQAQAWADEAARDGLLSDKDQRRYEHEQSQMELMQFVEQLRTVRAPAHRCAALPGALTARDAGRDGQPVRVPDAHAD